MERSRLKWTTPIVSLLLGYVILKTHILHCAFNLAMPLSHPNGSKLVEAFSVCEHYMFKLFIYIYTFLILRFLVFHYVKHLRILLKAQYYYILKQESCFCSFSLRYI